MVDTSEMSNYDSFNNTLNTPVGEGQAVSATGNKNNAVNPQSQSTIQKSELDITELILLGLVSGLPLLDPTPPESTSTGSNRIEAGIARINENNPAYIAFAMQLEKKKADIIESMWDAYMEGIRDFAARIKEEDRRHEAIRAQKGGPKSPAEYLAHLFAISANERFNEKDNKVGGLEEAFNNLRPWFKPERSELDNSVTINPINGAPIVGLPDYPHSTFIAGALVANADLIRGAIGGVSLALGYQISSSPVADALFASGPTSGLPGDYQAAAAMIAALLYGGAIIKATNDTIAEAAKKGEPPKDLDFAINFAKSIMAIITHHVEGEKTNPLREGQNQLIRLMLATIALNLLYRAAFGGMTGEELKGLLNGETENIPDTIKPQVEQLIEAIKLFLPTEPKAREEAIANLMAYIDKKTPLEEMLKITQDYSVMLQSSDNIEDERFIVKD